jgi:hypothetical protein
VNEPYLKLVPAATPVATPVATQDEAPDEAQPAPLATVTPASAAHAALLRPTAATALARLQSYTSRALAESAYRLRRVGATGLSGIALVVAALVLFIANNLPQSTAVAALKAQILHLAPLGHAPLAAAPGGTVLAALPKRDDAPTVVGKVFAQAAAAGVELSRGQYEFVPSRDGVAARYRMTFPVHTTYPKLRDFMDRTLIALPAVAIEGLRVERKKVGDEEVDAELKLSAYVRSEP